MLCGDCTRNPLYQIDNGTAAAILVSVILEPEKDRGGMGPGELRPISFAGLFARRNDEGTHTGRRFRLRLIELRIRPPELPSPKVENSELVPKLYTTKQSTG